MRALLLIALCCALMLPAAAQSAPSASVAVESAFMRAAPEESAEMAGSAFDGERLTVVGRNADGSWLQVHRPMTPNRTAWIRRDIVTFSGDVTLLPLTDFVTGVTGPEPLTDTGLAALFTGEAQLRAQPDRFAASAGVVPIGAVAQIIARAPNNFWLKVNYLGTVGWVAEFTTRISVDFNNLPVAPELADDPAYAPMDVVDPVLQVAQIDRLLVYLDNHSTLASDVAHYWRQLLNGETRECLPPADVVPYAFTAADVAELPELRQQTRLLNLATTDLNESIEAMRRCGVYINSELNAAYNNAVSARNSYAVLTRRMRTLRERITGEKLKD